MIALRYQQLQARTSDHLFESSLEYECGIVDISGGCSRVTGYPETMLNFRLADEAEVAAGQASIASVVEHGYSTGS
jgi:hypothetical protein